MTGAKTAEVIALELMHDDVESPIPLERSDLVGEVVSVYKIVRTNQ